MDVNAGWYPDPEDPRNLRWWDGSTWTDHRQPLDASAAPAETSPEVPSEAAAESPAEPDPGTDVPDETVATPEVAADTQPEQVPDQASDPSPAADPIPATEPTAVIPPPPPTGGDAPPTEQVPAFSTAPVPPAVDSPSGGKSKKPLIIVGVVAVIALIGAGAFFLLGGDDAPDYTWEGEEIADLEATLEDADAAFLAGVEDRHGAVTDDSRCYAVQSADEDAEEPSDLLDFLRCGPVLFVDNDPNDGVWLTYALDAEEGDDGVVLTSAEQPQSSQPSRYDDDEELISRPDGETPPEGDGGVEAPEPPRAEEGLFVAQDPVLDDVELDFTYVRAVGLTKSMSLEAVGEPERYGFGDSARRPADGERFIVFEVSPGQGDEYYGSSGDQSDRYNSSTATISLNVDGEKTVLFEDADDADAPSNRFLVSVPESAEVVDLVLVDSEVTQRISLLTQEPAGNNLQVLARDFREVELGDSKAFPVVITHPDGFVQNDTFTVTVEAAELLYYVDDVPDRVPSGPKKAFMVIHHFVTSDQTGITKEDDIALEPGHMHLQIEGGAMVEAINLAPADGDLLVAFEVPAGFTSGTLSISGAAPSGDINIDLAQPDFKIPIEIENF